MNELVQVVKIEKRIFTIRGVQVMLDRDLAELYEVNPIRLREKFKRNIDRFPVGSKRKRHSPVEVVPFSILP